MQDFPLSLIGTPDRPRWGQAEGAYAAMHRTKPQTAAVGLTDSPVGGHVRIPVDVARCAAA